MNHRVKLLFLFSLLPFLLTYCAGASSKAKLPQPTSDVELESSQPPSVSSSSAELSTVTQITHSHTSGVSRVVFELDRETRYTMLQAGDKLIMDIFDGNLNPPHQEIPVEDTLIKSLIVDQVENSIVRATLTLYDTQIAYNLSTTEQPFQLIVNMRKPPESGVTGPTSSTIESTPSVTLAGSQIPTAPSNSLTATSEPEEKQPFQSFSVASQSPSSSVRTSGKDYVIGPGDILKLTVLGEESFNKTHTVSPVGLITLPLLGDLRVDGLTITQLDNKITELLAKDYLVDPQVTVELIKSRSRRVSIIGAVRQPGSYELTEGSRVLNTLLSAGGPSSFNSELKILRLPQKEESKYDTDTVTVTPLIIDLRKLFIEGDVSQDITLQDGDVLIVSELGKKQEESSDGGSKQGGQIYVLGSVKSPGIYKYQEGDTVLDVILRAGGFSEYASRNGTKVVREVEGKTETFKVKMEDVMKKGDRGKNPPVYPEDMIIVPESFF